MRWDDKQQQATLYSTNNRAVTPLPIPLYCYHTPTNTAATLQHYSELTDTTTRQSRVTSSTRFIIPFHSTATPPIRPRQTEARLCARWCSIHLYYSSHPNQSPTLSCPSSPLPQLSSSNFDSPSCSLLVPSCPVLLFRSHTYRLFPYIRIRHRPLDIHRADSRLSSSVVMSVAVVSVHSL